jgi:glycosyltransferase involved in cell wall biosynthesis
MDVALIITTYNWPEALKMTLQSVLGQTRRPDEVLIADDGSRAKTADTVERLLRSSGLKWYHVWQEDREVRQSRIKNLAVRYSSAEYLIFVDQDVVLHGEFVADHLSMAEKGTFLQGKRVLLSLFRTERMLERGSFSQPGCWMKGIRNRKNALRIPFLGKWLAMRKKFQESLRGCNLSMFKSDFLDVDGFDEVFDGSWGREDSDVCYRLFHKGLRVKNLWFLALQYHLYHKVVRDWERERLDSEIKRNLREKRGKAVRGFSQLSSEGEVIGAYDRSS